MANSEGKEIDCEEEKFKSLFIDVENGSFRLNGREMANNVHYMQLTFDEGKWSLETKESYYQ